MSFQKKIIKKVRVRLVEVELQTRQECHADLARIEFDDILSAMRILSIMIALHESEILTQEMRRRYSSVASELMWFRDELKLRNIG